MSAGVLNILLVTLLRISVDPLVLEIVPDFQLATFFKNKLFHIYFQDFCPLYRITAQWLLPNWTQEFILKTKEI